MKESNETEVQLQDLQPNDEHSTVQAIPNGEAKSRAEGSVKTKISDASTYMDAKDIPWGKICCILLCVASDSIALMAPLPYLPQFCRNQLNIPEGQVGAYVGALIGVFSLANFCSSAFLGYLSDVYGRKIFLVSGVLITCIFTVAFGFVTNVWVGISARIIIGLFNANFAIGKAAIADLVPPHLRALPFAYTGASYALARAFSSSIGGLSVGLFLVDDFGPYLAPSIISSIPLVFAFVNTILFLPETNKQRKVDNILKDLFYRDWRKGPALHGLATRNDAKSQSKQSFAQGLKVISEDRVLVWCIIAFDLLAFANGGLFSAAVLWMTSSLKGHGMQMHEREAGICFTIFGLSGFFFQILLFDRVNKILGLRRMLQVGMVSMCAGCIVLPVGQAILAQMDLVLTIWRWILLVPSLGMLGIGFVLALPVLSTMISNSTRPDIQGLTQGVAQSSSSLLRGCGPFTVGFVFSEFFDLHAPAISFLILGVPYAWALGIALWLPARVEGVLTNPKHEASPALHNAAESKPSAQAQFSSSSQARAYPGTSTKNAWSMFGRSNNIRNGGHDDKECGIESLIDDDSVAASHAAEEVGVVVELHDACVSNGHSDGTGALQGGMDRHVLMEKKRLEG